jgi:DNA-binding CsgD family transcriptional regulator
MQTLRRIVTAAMIGLGASVTLCDSQGHLIWTSYPKPIREVGSFVWEFACDKDADLVKSAFSRAIALREPQHYVACDLEKNTYRVWMWPLDLQDAALCILALLVPSELQLLTARERDCLALLAEGRSPTDIASRLDVSVSTIHTHFKRAREKLKLGTTEELICFAARHSTPQGPFWTSLKKS